MSYIRRGDIMIHSMDLSQLTSNSRLGSNINCYDSMEASLSESNEHYATLGRQHRNTRLRCSSPQSHRSNTNASHIPYTRYIRPCNNLHELNEQNGVIKPITETDESLYPTQIRTRKQMRRDRVRTGKRKVIYSFVCGMVIGLIISSVVWLTVDRLKENKVICEFSYNSKGEANINDKTKIPSAEIIVNSTTQTHSTVADETGESSVTNTSVSMTTKHTESSHSAPLSIFSTKTTLPSSSTSPTRKQSTAASLTEERTNAKLSTVFSTTFSDIPSTSEPSSTIQSSTKQPVSTLQNSYISSTSRISSKANAFASTTNITDQTTSPRTSVTQPMTSIVSDTSTSKQTTLHQNESSQTTIFGSNSSVLTTTKQDYFTADSSTSEPPTSKSVLTSSATGYSSTLVPLASTSVLSSVGGSSSTTSVPEDNFPETVDKRSVQGGHVYVRWGSMSCMSQSEQLYKGYVAGGHYQHQGGATNTLCLPEVPTWGNYSDNSDADRALVYGTEYGSSDSSFKATTGQQVKNKDVPCSVCQATGRLSHVMIPGKAECFPGWTLEYKGYIMGSGYIHHGSELICVDSSPDHVSGTGAFKGGKLLYLAEVRTGTLPSPPYVNGRELACVVCTL